MYGGQCHDRHRDARERCDPVRSLLWEFLSWAFGGKDDCMIVKGARGKMWPSSLLCLL